MEQHDSPSGFVPGAYDRPAQQAKADAISPLRRHWRIPAAVTSMAIVAALCLHTGSTAHAATTSAAKPAGPVAHPAVYTGGNASLKGHIETAADSATGGVHGAFNLYDGEGGGIEFWFNPSTGQMTVAVGVGVGDGGGAVLGTYAPGSEPAPGLYVYANADLSASTVGSVNVAGSYSFNDGVFVGTVNTTIDGRTLTISSDGSKSFDVNVYAAEGAAGFTGAVGVNYTFNFNVSDVINYIWNAITNFFTGNYTLGANQNTGNETTAYQDDSSTDDDSALTTTDDSIGDTSTSDDSSDDVSSSSSTDDSDSAGCGGGVSDDDDDSHDAF